MSVSTPPAATSGHERIAVNGSASDLAQVIAQLSTEVAALRGEVSALHAKLEPRSPRVSILKEPLTYEARLVRDSQAIDLAGRRLGFRAVPTRENHSYVRDVALTALRMGDWRPCEERLKQHVKEMEVLAAERERIFAPGVEYEQRAVNWTSGTGGYFAPPAWLVEYFAVVPTPARILSAKAPQFELPEGCQSVNLPAWSGSSADVGVQNLGSPPTSVDLTDTAVESAVVTIAGNEDVPLQMLEQSPVGAHLDWAVFTNMEARYGFKLEQQLYVGNGPATPQGSGSDQLLGIFATNSQVPTSNQVSYTGAGEGQSTGATSMFTFLGLLPAKIGQNRLLPPQGWIMSTSRGAWFASSEDQQSRPLMISDTPNTDDIEGEWDLMGYPVWLSDALPRTLGTGQNEDRILSVRPDDWLILESERRTNVFREVVSGSLMARIQLRRYVAALLRFPTSVSYLFGSGMATGGGF